MKYEFLLIDLDNTILDFGRTEHAALGSTLRQFGLEPTEEVRARYSVINKAHWDKLATGEMTRQQVLLGRFQTLLAEYGIDCDPAECARCYENHIANGPHYFLPGAGEALAELAKDHKLYLASNGTAQMQDGKLKNLGIRSLFQDIFVSETMGADKPSLTYYERCFARIEGFDPSRAMMVGDSLNADIQGGINAGIATCWLNLEGKPGNLQPDYEISALADLPALLKTL